MSVFTLLRSALQCLQTSPNRPLPWFHYSQRSIPLPHDLLSFFPLFIPLPLPRLFAPSSFGIAKVLPFPFPTKCFHNFFLSPYFNALIPTKKNIAIYYYGTLENRCFLRLFRNSGKTFSVFDRAAFHVGLPQFLSASSQNFLYFVSHCYVLRFTNIHKAFSAKQMPTLRCLKTVTKPQ